MCDDLELQDLVSGSLDLMVKETGYRELISMSPKDVAVELINNDPDFEEREIYDLIEFVETWQKERK